MSRSVVSSRKASAFRYIKPAKRRASQYEEITLHTQWDPKNFASQGWFNVDKHGRPLWSDDSTLLKSTDWWAYRDPQAEWFRPFVKRQANTGRAIEQAIQGARRADLYANYESSWVSFLAGFYASYRYVEYGLFMVLCQAQREAGSDVIAQPIVFQSIEKDRHAQDIALYCLELESGIDQFSDGSCKTGWMEATEWQPTRKVIELLLATRDWGEINLVINCLFEPIVSTLFNRELVLKNAPLHGDTITAVIAEGAEADREIRRNSTQAFIEMLLEQQPDNRAVIQGWYKKWLPLVQDAVQAMAPMFDLPSRCCQSFEQAYARVMNEFEQQNNALTIGG